MTMGLVRALAEGLPDRDYSLTGDSAAHARATGLVDGDWFRSPVDHDRMRELTERSNTRAMVDVVIWLGLIVILGAAAVWSIGNWWAIPLFGAYGAVAVGAADARWHEFGHGTAARSGRFNDAVYWFASFQLWRGPTLWRWSHFRHHSDTIIVGRDPEIQLGRPARIRGLVLNYTNALNGPRSFWRLVRHSVGRIDTEALDFVPEHEQQKLVVEARIIVGLTLASVITSIVLTSWVPVLLVGLPTMYGAWLMVFFGATQHLGLREDVLDHRYSTRTVYMNPVFRFLYLNMNYHVEHHMFPAVPYHQLPALHDEIKHTLPTPSPSMWHAYREIVTALWRQRSDVWYEVESRLVPEVEPATSTQGRLGFERPDGLFDLGPVALVETGSISRVDVGGRTFAVARTTDDEVYVVDGWCTHRRAHLADGVIIEATSGRQIECPKHNGRFDLATGSPCRKPVTIPVATHPVDAFDASRHVLVSSVVSPASSSTSPSPNSSPDVKETMS